MYVHLYTYTHPSTPRHTCVPSHRHGHTSADLRACTYTDVRLYNVIQSIHPDPNHTCTLMYTPPQPYAPLSSYMCTRMPRTYHACARVPPIPPPQPSAPIMIIMSIIIIMIITMIIMIIIMILIMIITLILVILIPQLLYYYYYYYYES